MRASCGPLERPLPALACACPGRILLFFYASAARVMRWARVPLDAVRSREAAPEPQQSRVPLLRFPLQPRSIPRPIFLVTGFIFPPGTPPTHTPTHPPTPHLTHPPSLPLQRGWTPLHAAAWNGRAPVVALLLATPGVAPLAKTRGVRGAQRWLRCLPACLMAPDLWRRQSTLRWTWRR